MSPTDGAVIYKWSPNKADPKPPPHPLTEKNCYTCASERDNRKPWTLECGFADEHLEILAATDNIKDCINWWDIISHIQWDMSDELKLARKYVEKLAILNAQSIWGGSGKVLHLTKYLPKPKKDSANEDWFKANAQDVPIKQAWMRGRYG
jgi:hypothetical protein